MGPVGGRVDHVGDQPDVAELQVGRVVEIDGGVAEGVEDQIAHRRVLLVDHHPAAEVGRLELARRVRRCADRERREQHDDECGGRGLAAGDDDEARPTNTRASTDAQHDRAGGDRGDEDETGDERAEECTGGSPCRQVADDGAGLVERVEPKLGRHRRDRAEDGGGCEERERGQQRRSPAVRCRARARAPTRATTTTMRAHRRGRGRGRS